MYYLRARYYIPTKGRFLTRDRVELRDGGALPGHAYVYGYSDPVKWRDPSGLDGTEQSLQVGFVVEPGAHALLHIATETAVGGAWEGLTQAEIEAAVEAAVREVVTPGTPVGTWFADFMLYINNDVPVFWRAFVVSDLLVKISTIFPVKFQ